MRLNVLIAKIEAITLENINNSDDLVIGVKRLKVCDHASAMFILSERVHNISHHCPRNGCRECLQLTKNEIL